MEEEDALRGTDDESEEEESDSDDEKKWDCQTILSTFSNTDNHPAVIKTNRIIKPKNQIQLHKQFKVPIEGLMAEEIDNSANKQSKSKNKAGKSGKPFEVVEEIESDEDVE